MAELGALLAPFAKWVGGGLVLVGGALVALWLRTRYAEKRGAERRELETVKDANQERSEAGEEYREDLADSLDRWDRARADAGRVPDDPDRDDPAAEPGVSDES